MTTPGDPCGAAINIPSVPVTNQAVVCSSTNNLSSSNVSSPCGGATTSYMGGNEALYTFTPSTSGTYTISYSGQSWNAIFVYSGACPASGGTCVGSVSNSGTSSSLNISFTAGIQYYIWFDTWPSPNSPCPGTFSISPMVPPANDECSGAITVPVNPNLTCTNTVSGTVLNATASSQTNACSGTADDDVWFKFVATNTTHFINLNNVAGSTTDLYHSVYSGTCSSIGSPLVCSDPNNSTVSGLTIGNTYYIRVYTWTSTSGQTTTFDVCVTTPPPPPANDECAGAITVPVNPGLTCTNTVAGTVGSATASPQSNDCYGTPDDDVWFKFVATSTTHNIDLINVAGSTTDLYHSVYSGTCSSIGSPLVCSDPNNSTVSGLTIGNTYYIRVYTWTSTSGQTTTFDVCVTTPPDPCESPQSTGGDYISGFSTTGGLTNITNPLNGGPNGGYTDYYNTHSASIAPGGVMNWEVGYVGGSFGFAIWVDWNNDGSYSTSERLYNSNTYLNSPASGSITIPSSTPSGTYRMRIRANYSSTSPDPCETITYGEAEDYKLIVIQPDPCTGVPDGGVAILNPTYGAPSTSFNGHVNGGEVATGLIYQWQYSDNGGTNWYNLAGETGATLSTTAQPFVGVRLYRRRTECTNNPGQYGYSTPATFSTEIGGAICSDIQGFCSDESYSFPTVTGYDYAPTGPNYGCLSSQPNPSWYFLRIEQSGSLLIEIEQLSTSGYQIDVDFAMWGPFDDLDEGCSEVMAGGLNPIQCSYSIDGIEYIGLGFQGGGCLGGNCGTSTPDPAIAGEYYIVLITNYNGGNGTLNLNQIDGDGISDCNIINPCNPILTTEPIETCGTNSVDLNDAIVYASVAANYTFYASQTDAQSETNPISSMVSTSGIYWVRAVDPNDDDCFSIYRINVDIKPGPQIDLDSDMAICEGDNATIPAINNGGTVDIQEIQVGSVISGSNVRLNYGWYKYGYSRTLYTQSEIGTAGNIQTLSFFVEDSPNNYTLNNQKIYMRNVGSKSAYGTTYNSDPVNGNGSFNPSSNGYTLVYDGSITYNGNGWHTITFATPFAYSGTGNIEVVWLNQNGTSNSGHPQFRYEVVSNYSVAYDFSQTANPPTNSANWGVAPYKFWALFGIEVDITPVISWSGGPIVSGGTTLNPVVNPTSSTTYTMQASSQGCTVTQSILIDVDEKPVAPTILTFDHNQDNCHGREITIYGTNGSIPGTSEYVWGTSVGGTNISNGTTSTEVNHIPTSTTTYYVSVTGNGECPGETNTSGITYSLPGKGNNLSGNESAKCYLSGNTRIHFYAPSGNYIGSINPNGKEATVTMESHLTGLSTNTMEACGHSGNPLYETAFMERSFKVTEHSVNGTGDYNIYFPYTQGEFNNVNYASNNITNQNLLDNISGHGSLGVTKYNGPIENTTPYDNCNAGSSVFIAQNDHPNNGNGALSGLSLSPAISGYYINFMVPGFSEFYIHGSSVDSPLPVELISFTTTCKEGKTYINWSTASETNSDYFTVEFSRDGISWQTVATVDGAGNSSNQNDYLVIDNSARGTGYYRLVQTNYNGESEVFGPISSNCDPQENSLTVYPNPSTGQFTVEIISSSDLGISNVVVIEANGKKVAQQSVDVQKGVNEVYFNEQLLAPGTYIISIEGSEKGKFTPVKLVITQ